MFSFWADRFLLYELLLVCILSITFVVGFLLFDWDKYVNELMMNNRGSVYRTIAGVSSTLLGFTIAGTSVFYALSNSDSLSMLRNSPAYSTLWRVIVGTMRALGSLTIISIVSLIFERGDSPGMLLTIPLLFCLLLSVVRFVRLIWIIEQMTKIISIGSLRM